jgi:DNA polymerase-3 subunit delta
MKLQTRDIPGFLQKPQSVAAVLLYGPDQGLILQRGKQIAQIVLGAKYDPHNLTEITEEKLKADPPLLRDELTAMSLLASGRRAVLLRDASDKCAPIIEEACIGLAPDAAYLIVQSDDLGPSSALRKLFESRREFAALPCYRDDGRTLEAVIAERLRGHGIQTTSDVIRFIAAHEGADRQVTLQEMDKLALYLGDEKKLTLEMAQSIAAQNDYLSQDDLSVALAAGDRVQLAACLSRSLAEGISPVAVCRALQRYFQRLLFLHGALSQGMPLDDAVSRLRPPVFFKYAQPLKNHMRRWSSADVRAALSALLSAERGLKSSPLPPSLLLSQALSEIAALPERKKAA